MPKTVANENYEKLESEVTSLKESEPLSIKIVLGSENKKNEFFDQILETARKHKVDATHVMLADLTEDTEELMKNVIIIDDIDLFIFQPPLGRLSLKKKLDKFLEDLEPGSGKILIFGIKADEALNYFKRKFKDLHSKAEVIDIK
jgi:archaellum biogenesis ATPase FlaH